MSKGRQRNLMMSRLRRRAQVVFGLKAHRHKGIIATLSQKRDKTQELTPNTLTSTAVEEMARKMDGYFIHQPGGQRGWQR